MEADEVREFVEKQTEARESKLFEVSFSISLIAVLVALATVLSHRAHTAAVLSQARASDSWAFYQARRARQVAATNTADLLSVLAPPSAGTQARIDTLRESASHYDAALKQNEEEARRQEEQVELHEHRASRFDSGEALLQIAIVLCSVTLLTRQRIYWLAGLALGGAGAVFALLGFLAH